MGASTGVNNGPGILQESAAGTRKTPTETVQTGEKKVERCFAEMKRGGKGVRSIRIGQKSLSIAARLITYVIHILTCVINWKINWFTVNLFIFYTVNNI